MLGDRKDILGKAELSVDDNHAVDTVIKFIDNIISGFPSYYFSEPGLSSDENAITYHIVNYFNSHLDDRSSGFIPYRFVKNPPQQDSRKETDLGVVISSKSGPMFPIIEFEAKRLSNTSNNSEYVYGERGGIERFKRNQHGTKLNICGMLGYLQDNVCSHWTTKINGWITDQASRLDNDVDWKHIDEKLVRTSSFTKVEKWRSKHKRLSGSPLFIHHYFIDLVQDEKSK